MDNITGTDAETSELVKLRDLIIGWLAKNPKSSEEKAETPEDAAAETETPMEAEHGETIPHGVTVIALQAARDARKRNGK